MVHKIKYLNLIIFMAAFVFMACLAISTKGNIETNLLKTLLPKDAIKTSSIIPVLNKSSSRVKVVFQSDNEKNLEALKTEFENQIDKDYFEINKPDVSKLLKKHLTNPTNFLSNKTRALLKAKKYDEVYDSSMERLYSPTSIQLTTMDKDPYLLFDDYVISNKRISQGNKNLDGKYYDSMTLKIKKNEGLSPDLSKSKITELVKLQKKLSKKPNKIYLAGTPIHSYYASQKSVADINLICLISTIMILLLTYFYFRNVKILIPVVLSTTFGLLCGYVGTRLWFNNFQIITMVFSTTLIGIGIDYSYHYFFAGKINKTFFKNLTFSLVTTLIPFLLLYFSGLDLLKQISVFTTCGLVAIYLTVLLVYPCFEIPQNKVELKFNSKLYKYILTALACVCLIGLTRLHFNDTLTALYSPPSSLQKAETLYTKVSGDELQNTQIITVSGKNIEDIIEKEENITNEFNNEDIEYISISKFLPSLARQKDNNVLVKNLYQRTLHRYSDILSYSQIRSLKARKFSPVMFNINDFPFFNDFMLTPNTSMIFVFSDKNLFINDKTANVVNLKSDISKYLRKYRVHLFYMLPVSIILLIILLSVIFGKDNGYRIVAPSIYGAIGAVGMTSFIFGEINLFSIISLYLVLGFTMDYSIFRLNPSDKTENALFASSLTTSFSFLMLALAGFKLLSSMAFILLFGIIISYLSGYFIFSEQEK